jgi:crotonobetainyl-CoA:carnitine CoA-transferase CaiB-like acyl-CoA transferase
MLPNGFALLNRGKNGIAVDLREPADRELLLTLAAGADVLIEGFRPGVAERLGVGFGDVRVRAPRIVYVSLSGYGQAGPLVDAPGHDLNYVARAGGVALSGVEDGVSGYDGTYQVADLATAAYTVIAVLAAIHAPRYAARHIDISLFGSALAFGQLAAAEGSDTHQVDEPLRHGREPRGANGVFVARDGLPLTICAVEEHFFAALGAALERPDLLSNDKYATYTGRLTHGRDLNNTLEELISTRNRDEWLEKLSSFGVPCSPVLTYTEALASQQAYALGLPTTDPHAVTLPTRGLPRLPLGAPPQLGEHTRQARTEGWAAFRQP